MVRCVALRPKLGGVVPADGVMRRTGDDDMIQQADVQNFASLDHRSGQINVLRAFAWIAGGVIMRQNDPIDIAAHRLFEYFTYAHRSGVLGAL